MTPAALALARDGDSTATQAATDLWATVTGEVDARRAGVALDSVSAHVGAETDVPSFTLGEAVIRTGAYLANSAPLLGFHGATGVGPEGDSRVGGYSALRRSGAMALLAPHAVRRAGAV